MESRQTTTLILTYRTGHGEQVLASGMESEAGSASS